MTGTERLRVGEGCRSVAFSAKVRRATACKSGIRAPTRTHTILFHCPTEILFLTSNAQFVARFRSIEVQKTFTMNTKTLSNVTLSEFFIQPNEFQFFIHQ